MRLGVASPHESSMNVDWEAPLEVIAHAWEWDLDVDHVLWRGGWNQRGPVYH
jgi:hypothetical protein